MTNSNAYIVVILFFLHLWSQVLARELSEGDSRTEKMEYYPKQILPIQPVKPIPPMNRNPSPRQPPFTPEEDQPPPRRYNIHTTKMDHPLSRKDIIGGGILNLISNNIYLNLTIFFNFVSISQ
ncbi:hypothetical protein PIB30_084671 [Stylosanthes scabra]|uniref:Uncharacterized protein n=1 Tax=Stylosanthes scabra TaxID=79078 RepID=A0ABU6VRU7_9FABA|nr:hypothetical protein [Stylosanthes scabra]